MNGRLDVFKAGRRVAVGRRRTQRGVTLLEVMISVLILGVGILGIAAMQTTALRNSQSSFERSQAVMHSYAIIDAMRANRVAALAGAYNMAMACAAPGLGGGTLAETDLNQWIVSMKTGMGGSAADTTTCGSIACDTGNCTVVVQWDDSRATDGASAGPQQGDDKYQVTTAVTL